MGRYFIATLVVLFLVGLLFALGALIPAFVQNVRSLY